MFIVKMNETEWWWMGWSIEHIDIIQTIEWDWGAWVRSQLFLTT